MRAGASLRQTAQPCRLDNEREGSFMTDKKKPAGETGRYCFLTDELRLRVRV